MKIDIFFNQNQPGVYHIDGLYGSISIYQEYEDEPTRFNVNVGGLTPNHLHGFHIHENSVKNKDDLEKTCDTCGGHFNPTNKDHGSIFNKDKGKNRHVGDLINNLKADENGECILEFKDDLARLIPNDKNPYTIIGRSLVIHEDTDDLGRQGLDDKTPYIISKKNKNQVINKNHKQVEQKYQNKEKRKSSKVNGNAGKRIACANII